MGHLVVDWPTPEAAVALVEIMVAAGVKVIELQIPFSEPIADGPVIMAANHGALANGVTVQRCFDFMRQMTTRFQLPFLFMSYVNPIYRIGWEQFAEAAAAAGARGVIVPDLPVDLSQELDQACSRCGLANIRVIPPNISDERLRRICSQARGMIYAVARQGVTGSRTELNQDVKDFVARIRTATALPVAVGFGISSPSDVEFLRGAADLAVIGSQTFRELARGGLDQVQRFWADLSRVIGNGT